MSRDALREVGPWLGIVAITVTLGSIGIATVVSPAFSWSGNALSDLGVTSDDAGTTTTVALFNGGLIVGGLLGTGFSGWLFGRLDTLLARVGAIVLVGSMLCMGGVGVFPKDHQLHFPVAVGFYLLFSVATLIVASGQFLGGDRRLSALSVTMGGGNLLVWVAWGTTGGVTRPGLAIPELLGALCVSLWTVGTAVTYTDTKLSRLSPRR